MSVVDAIDVASELLPGAAAPEGANDPRWQAIIDVAEFIPSNPDEVWAFAARWGAYPDPDLQAAVATCVLEHLLEHHFAAVFPKAAALARTDRVFARTLRICWLSGEGENSENAHVFGQLMREIGGAV